MSLTHANLVIKKQRLRSPSTKVCFLIDSGAEYSVVPEKTLHDLGVEAHREIEIVLADGSRKKRKVGDAYFEFQGQVAASPVIFGEAQDEALLGVVTLESLGLLLDPLSRRISKREWIRM